LQIEETAHWGPMSSHDLVRDAHTHTHARANRRGSLGVGNFFRIDLVIYIHMYIHTYKLEVHSDHCIGSAYPEKKVSLLFSPSHADHERGPKALPRCSEEIRTMLTLTSRKFFQRKRLGRYLKSVLSRPLPPPLLPLHVGIHE
jgi:hypothetical protein